MQEDRYTAPTGMVQRRAGRVAAIILVTTAIALALAALAFWLLPALLVTTNAVPNAVQRIKLQNDVRTTGVQLLGGVVLAIGAFFTARNIQINRDYQLTDRYTRAVEQLGHESVAVRLGGIYGLERIARESRKDHGPIVEILAAFIVANSTTRPGKALVLEDVQAALSVLGRRNRDHETGTNLVLDLSHSNLRGVNLRGATLDGAIFYGADFTGAWLGGASLAGASLATANLDGAYLLGADLRGVDFERTSLRAAELCFADLRGVDLTQADLEGAAVAECHLDAGTQWPENFDLGNALQRSEADDSVLKAAAAELEPVEEVTAQDPVGPDVGGDRPPPAP